ncbi:MAG: zf-HC2 domain-containing protein [Geodermatophilaceae bacterium]|nr:zf-HC2 domain-containing protein [Geodermatophilaceae bacterium]
MSWAEMHLATEAMAALVDNELSGGAAARARLHLSRCAECAAAVAAQAEAKTALFGSAGPMLPDTLLSRLVDIPFTAEMAPGMNDGVMALHGGSLMFGSAPQPAQLPTPPPLHAPALGTRTTGSGRGAFRLR